VKPPQLAPELGLVLPNFERHPRAAPHALPGHVARGHVATQRIAAIADNARIERVHRVRGQGHEQPRAVLKGRWLRRVVQAAAQGVSGGGAFNVCSRERRL